MCIHVYEGDSNESVVEAHAAAVKAVERAKTTEPGTWVTYLESQVQRIEKEVVRRWLAEQKQGQRVRV